MIRIVIQPEIAQQIRQSVGQIELVDDCGTRLGLVRRSPNEREIAEAKSRIGSTGRQIAVEALIAKIEAL